jgi:hypothetical protein
MSRKRIAFVVKLAVSGALIGFLLSRIEIGDVTARMAEATPGLFTLAVLVLAAQALVCTLRWGAVLSAIEAPLKFLKVLLGTFFNQTLPSSVGGDPVRMYKAHRAGLSVAGAINGVMLERAATVVGLVILVAATQPVFAARVGDAAPWMAPVVALFAVAMVAGLALVMVFDRLPARFHRWRVVRGMAALGVDSRRLFLSPVHAGKAIGWSVIGHANIALGVSLLAASMKIDATWLDCMALVPPVLLVTTIPISIAGWGVREGAMVAGFGFIGVVAADALALSVLFGLIVIALSLPGGAIWLLSGERRVSEQIETLSATERTPGAE